MVWTGLFGGSGTKRSERAPVTSGTLDPALGDPRQLLALHRQRLTALRLESGYGTEQFERLIAAQLSLVSEYVHALPATRAENHAEAGGLLRLAIETACLAFRRGDGKFLAGLASTSTDIRNRERDRVWRYAAFLGGLLRPLGRCATLMQVSAVESDVIWDPYQEGLWAWMRRIGCARIHTRWRDRADGRPVQAASIWIAARLATPAAMSYLRSADEALPEMLLHLLVGNRAGLVCEIVEDAFQAAIDQDLVRSAGARDVPVTALQIEHRLLEALRALVREKWTLNSPGSRLWMTQHGVFLVWKPAANDLAVRLRAEGVSGAPRDPDTIAELLLSHGVLAANPAAVGALKHYYKLTPNARGTPKQALEVVKLVDAELVGLNLDGVDAIEAELGSNPKSDPPVSPPQTAAPRSLELALDVSAPAEAPSAVRESGVETTSTVVASTEAESEVNPLSRFGEAGKVLRALAQRLRDEPQCVAVASVEGGLAVPYPDAITGLCDRPQEFLASCEAQGLLIPDKAAGRKLIRNGPTGKVPIRGQYVVFAARVSKHLISQMGR